MRSIVRCGLFLVIAVSLLGVTVACDTLVGSDDNGGTGDGDRTGAPSTNATLSSLTVSDGLLIPAFDPQTHEYSVTVLSSIDEITIDAATADENASLCANSGTAQPLNEGENSIGITVTAEDGSTTNVYAITATRHDYHIRDQGPAGGWIFYVDAQNDYEWTYLEAAPEDIEISSTREWQWGGRDAEIGLPAQGHAIGDGKANTAAIMEFFDSLYLMSDGETTYYDYDWEALHEHHGQERFTTDGENTYWFRGCHDGTVAAKRSVEP